MILFARASRCLGKFFRCTFPAADFATGGTCFLCLSSKSKNGLVCWKRNKMTVNLWRISWQDAISGAELPISRALFDNFNNLGI